jgi:hypothetical protein
MTGEFTVTTCGEGCTTSVVTVTFSEAGTITVGFDWTNALCPLPFGVLEKAWNEDCINVDVTWGVGEVGDGACDGSAATIRVYT